MKAAQQLTVAGYLVGFLGFLATWILDEVGIYLGKQGAKKASHITQIILRAIAPHFLVSRYDMICWLDSKCITMCTIQLLRRHSGSQWPDSKIAETNVSLWNWYQLVCNIAHLGSHATALACIHVSENPLRQHVPFFSDDTCSSHVASSKSAGFILPAGACMQYPRRTRRTRGARTLPHGPGKLLANTMPGPLYSALVSACAFEPCNEKLQA